MALRDYEPVEYATPVRPRRSWLKWVLFSFAVWMSFLSGVPLQGNSAGGAAGGLWIAFAIMHVYPPPE
jgi:hypothetical protein